MEWAVSYKSSYSILNNEILKNWQFANKGNNVDYVTNSFTNNSAVQYKGRTILSDEMINRVNQLNKQLSSNTSTSFFQDIKPMAQTLSGFNSQLLIRYHGIQLPILNENMAADEDAMHVGEQYSWYPLPKSDAYYPIRSGKVELKMLRVIDAFGQVLNIIPSKTNNGSDLGPSLNNGRLYHAASLPKADNAFMLAPRIAQPTKLSLNWLSALNEQKNTNSDPASTPITGWLMHDKLNNTISIFNAQGKELAELKAVNNQVLLVAAPGKQLNKIDGFMITIVDYAKKSYGCFLELMAQIYLVNNKALPKNSKQGLTMMLPIGNPIAVAKANVCLEMRDTLATNQFWNANSKLNDSFYDLKFTTTVGLANNKNDGLIAFFTSDEPLIQLPYLGKTNDSSFKQGGRIQIQANKPITLTLLLDPRMTISFSTAILPTAHFQLPQQMVEQAIKNIHLRFLIAPVLTNKKNLKMPLLQSRDISWTFQTWQNDGEKKAFIEQQPNSDIKDPLNFEPLQAVEGWLQMNVNNNKTS
jgi:hypothetical protein